MTHIYTRTNSGQENKKSVKIYSECKKQYAKAVEVASATERAKMAQRRQMAKEWRDADVGALIESRCQTDPSSFRDIAEELNRSYEKTKNHLDRPFTKNDCANKWRRLFPPSREPLDLKIDHKRLLSRFEYAIKHVPLQVVEEMVFKAEAIASQTRRKEREKALQLAEKTAVAPGSLAASWSSEVAQTSTNQPAPPVSTSTDNRDSRKRKLNALV